MRKNTLEYDNVVNKQREIVYSQRDTILEAEDLSEQLEHIVTTVISKVSEDEIKSQLNEGKNIDFTKLVKVIEPLYLDKGTLKIEELEKLSDKEVTEFITEKALEVLNTKAQEVGEDFTVIAKTVFINHIDEGWRENIGALDDLKQDVRYMSFKGEDPIKEYILRSYEVFSEWYLMHNQIQLNNY